MRFQSSSQVQNCTRLGVFLLIALLTQGALQRAVAEGGSVSPDGTARPVTINFDSLPTGVVVTPNQYQIATFQTDHYAGIPSGVYTIYDGGIGGSYPNGIEAHGINGGYYIYDGYYIYVNFAMPVSGLTFWVLNGSRPTDVSGTYAKCQVDVFVNHSYYGTWSIYQNGGSFAPIFVDALSGIQHITDVVFRPYFNCESYYCNFKYPLVYDDFTFTPELVANIINPRVNGGLDQTTQNALLGADISLQASVSNSGGTYSWTFTGPSVTTQRGSATSSSITVRSTDTGTVNAKLTYILNGVSVSPSVNINIVIPTLTSFTASQTSDTIAAPGTCGDGFGWWWYRLGCSAAQNNGIEFHAMVHAPTFISDPSQSGVKYVQAINTFRKKISLGERCRTKRSSDSDLRSGWQLDTSDPYDPSATLYFSAGNDLTMPTVVDFPGSALTGVSAYNFVDSLYLDDQFEMYLVYFTSTGIQPRPIGKLPWNWGGLVVFDWNGSNAVHTIRSTNVSPTSRSGQATSSMVPMQGNINDSSNIDVPCPGGPPLTSNKIDSSRNLVRWHYLDFLGRDPASPSSDHPDDPRGWNYWTSTMSWCVFDLNCIHRQKG